jgi:hypothetical protein
VVQKASGTSAPPCRYVASAARRGGSYRILVRFLLGTAESILPFSREFLRCAGFPPAFTGRPFTGDWLWPGGWNHLPMRFARLAAEAFRRRGQGDSLSARHQWRAFFKLLPSYTVTTILPICWLDSM